MESLAQSALRVATARWALGVLRTVLQEPTTAKLEEDLDMTVLLALLVSTAREQPTQSLMEAARQDITALPDPRLPTRRPRSQATTLRLVLPLPLLAQPVLMARLRLSLLACLAPLGFTVPIQACLTPTSTAQRARTARLQLARRQDQQRQQSVQQVLTATCSTSLPKVIASPAVLGTIAPPQAS